MEIFLKRSKHSLCVIAIILACAAAYGRSLPYGFVFEDKDLIVDNPLIKNARYLPEIFKTDMYGLAYEGAKPDYYRPVQSLSFMADYRLWKLNPFGYHLTSIFLHLLNSLAAYALVYLLFRSRFIAAVSGLLFCVHPIHVPAVVFITGRSDLCASLFMLSAFLCMALVAAHYGKNRAACLAAMFLCTLAALGSRENAVFMPFGVMLLWFFTAGGKKLKAMFLASTGLAVIIFFVFRVWLLGIPLARHEFLSMPVLVRLVNFLHVAASYVLLLVMPVGLSLMHTTAPVISASDARLWFTAGFYAVLLSVLFALRRNKILLFGTAWFFIFVSQAFFLMTGFYGNQINMFEHWVYQACLGAFVITGYLLFLLKRRSVIAAYSLACAILLACTVLTCVNSASYKDSVTLAARMLQRNPDNKEAHKELAGAYLAQKQYAAAYKHISAALALTPADPDLYLLLGAYREATGDAAAAVTAYEKLLTVEPHSARAYTNLGAIYFDQGDHAKARRCFVRAMALVPMLYEPYLNMAKLCARDNALDDAASFYVQAIRLNPDISEGFLGLARIYLSRGQAKSALDVLNRALIQGQGDADVLVLLGIASGESGSDAKALQYFKQALALDPGSEDALLNIGIFYAGHNQLGKALAVWKEALAAHPQNEAIRENISRAQVLLQESGR